MCSAGAMKRAAEGPVCDATLHHCCSFAISSAAVAVAGHRGRRHSCLPADRLGSKPPCGPAGAAACCTRVADGRFAHAHYLTAAAGVAARPAGAAAARPAGSGALQGCGSAAGEVGLALGTDLAGSLRFCRRAAVRMMDSLLLRNAAPPSAGPEMSVTPLPAGCRLRCAR